MKIGVSLKIDVTKIDKAHLFEGKKGKYLDATAFIDIDNKDQYENNGMITQDLGKDVPKDTKGAILGNTRIFWKDEGDQAGRAHERGINQAQQAVNDNSFDDDVPF